MIPVDPLEVIAVRIALAALVIALITLIAVGYQIVLARKEVKLVQEDLENNRRMIEDALKKPKLKTEAWGEFTQSHNHSPISTIIVVQVRNNGDRICNGYTLELLVPVSAFPSRPSNDASHYRMIDEIEWYVRPENVNDTVYPNDVLQEAYQFRFPLKSGVTTLDCYWRIYDAYGKYPAEDYGRYRFDVNPKLSKSPAIEI